VTPILGVTRARCSEPGTCRGLRYDRPNHSSDHTNPALAQSARCPPSGGAGRASGAGETL